MSTHHDRASESLVRSSSGHLDPLSDALEQVRLRGALFFVWEPSWPFATTVPQAREFAELILPGAGNIVSYHIVTEGPCWGAVAGEPPVALASGDILLIPHGDAYVISHEPTGPRADWDESQLDFFRRMAAGELPAVITEGDASGRRNRIVCGFLGCERRPFNPVLESLPRMVRVPAAETGPEDRLAILLELAVGESHAGTSGGRCVLLRLGEMLFVEVIRRFLAASGAGGHSSWLAALGDPTVGLALRLLHGSPAAAWSTERLADATCTSRSVLCERFTRLVGRPPMRYLCDWRMQLAARRLADGRAKVYAIAREVGYDSEAAFSRAFKRAVGVSPADWRNRAGGRPAGRPPSGGHPPDSYRSR